MPTSPTDTPSAPATPPARAGSNCQGYLLCIDDNPVNGLLIQEFFRMRTTLQVRVAGSGGEGLAMVRADPPLAVLLDLVLPDIDGLEVLARLRADDATRQVPVAIVSGSVHGDDLRRARQLGAQACWPKPLDLSRLDRMLDELLGFAPAPAAPLAFPLPQGNTGGPATPDLRSSPGSPDKPQRAAP